MKIAFTGCSGTGKTTLAKHVAEAFQIPYNPVGARTVAAEMGLKSPYDADDLGRRREFTDRLLLAKYLWEDGQESFVTDRCGTDSLVYQKLAGVAASRYATNTVYDHDSKYDLIVICSRSSFWDLGDDPVRKSSLGYHEAYEHDLAISLSIVTAGHPVQFYAMTSSALEDRKSEVVAAVGRLAK